MDYDFGGWATRANMKCSDGRTILKDAFKDNDGTTVPLVWNHQHNEPENVLGHALLENRGDGVYVYGKFNDTERAQNVKELIKHGDISALSIYANQLKEKAKNVIHGSIREVSLVLAGANPGAYIDTIMAHADDSDEEAIIYCGEDIVLSHSDSNKDCGNSSEKESKMEDNNENENKNDKTVEDIIDSMTEEQKTVLYALVAEAAAEINEDSEGGEEMKHNAFENDNNEAQGGVLSHSDMMTIIGDGKRYGSLKESFLAHAADYGIEDIEVLFPDAKDLNVPPEFIKRETNWVDKVMNGTHHIPFSRTKSMFADITEDAARAKGYIKGKLKKEEVFSLLKRTTAPTTIYKKQKIDRDDAIDITSFDVIVWLKSEMRMMLNEEIARAILIGDGRLSSDDDHIDENCIRPIINDADLFVIRYAVAEIESEARAKAFITAAIKARKNYKGSGNPSLFTTEDMLTDMLLLEDKMGHKLYKTEAELATALRVKEIVTVPVMEGCQDKDSRDVLGLIVNLNDYNVGADKGGTVSMFEDFDIDYNQQKYLIETRCSGSLVKPFSAIVIRSGETTGSEEPTLQNAMKPFKTNQQ